jgi:hypothetical protein
MDITTGPGLVEAIAEEINRDDLLATIPSWIKMAESGFNQALRCREMVKRSTTVTEEAHVVLPLDFREMKSVKIVDPVKGPRTLFLSSEDAINDPRLRGSWVADPRYFTIVGNEIELSPYRPGATYEVEMTYFSAVPSLDLTTPGATTWLLAKAPQLYLYAALLHSAPYMMEDARLETWKLLAQDALVALNTEYDRSRTAGSSIREVRKSIGAVSAPRP